MREGNGRPSPCELPVSISSSFFLPSSLLHRFPFIAFLFFGSASSSSPRCSLRTTRFFFLPPVDVLLFATPYRIRDDCNFNSGGISPLAPRPHRSSFEGVCSSYASVHVYLCACVCVRIYGSCITPFNSSSNTSSLSLSSLILAPGRIPILGS